jgi:hypothetical protein
MMSVVINNSLNLFQSEFPGVRTVIPAYVAAIDQVLTSAKPIDGISSKSQLLRNSCIKLLGSFLALPHHFGGLSFKLDAEVEQHRIALYLMLYLRSVYQCHIL